MANLELRDIKISARPNPGLLNVGGKEAWFTVRLLKYLSIPAHFGE
jgi:hypothetical protein